MKINVISPHIDDATLSCGGLISNLIAKERYELTITNIFCWGRESACYDDKKRIFEEWQVFDKARLIYLNEKDVTYRENMKEIIWDKVYLQENEELSCEIVKKSEDIANRVDSLFKLESFDFVYFPLGFGDHKDHIICNLVGKILDSKFNNILFYKDVPYKDGCYCCLDEYHIVDSTVFNLSKKLNMILNYESGLSLINLTELIGSLSNIENYYKLKSIN